MAAQLDHYYLFGDVYATLDTCDELEQLLNRLQRLQLVGDQDWTDSRHHLTEIRSSLEGILAA
jgi:hypothetical protein